MNRQNRHGVEPSAAPNARIGQFRPATRRSRAVWATGWRLRRLEDSVVANSAPADGRRLDLAPALLHVDLDPLPGRAAVRAGERPGHLEDARAVDDRLHPEPSGPGVR